MTEEYTVNQVAEIDKHLRQAQYEGRKKVLKELEKELDTIADQLTKQLDDPECNQNYIAITGFLNQRSMIAHIKKQILPKLYSGGYV